MIRAPQRDIVRRVEKTQIKVATKSDPPDRDEQDEFNRWLIAAALFFRIPYQTAQEGGRWVLYLRLPLAEDRLRMAGAMRQLLDRPIMGDLITVEEIE